MDADKIVYGFIHDPAFIDRSNQISQVFPEGGQYVPSSQSLSYFKSLWRVDDPRPTRNPTPPYNFSTISKILLDQDTYQDFIDLYETLTTAEKNQLFNITDRVFFRPQPNDSTISVNTELTLFPALYGVYVENSLVLSTTKTPGIAYGDGGLEVQITGPQWVRFKVRWVGPQGEEIVEIKLWANDIAFNQDYPLFHIMEVVPPLPFDVLLYDSLIAGVSNKFATALTNATITQQKLNPKIRSDDSTGYHMQRIKFFDTVGNMTLVPFGILYKGMKPTLSQIRKAIKALVLGSGVGTIPEWRRRAPELFIDHTFYLVPQWNIVTYRPNEVVYPNTIPYPKALSNAVIIFGQFSEQYITDTLEQITVNYDTMTCTSTPDPENVSEVKVLELHPTYRNFSSTDPGFSFMDPRTREFSILLNKCLAIAAGKASDPNYEVRDESGNNYVPFTVDYAEFLVMTKESFANEVGIPQP